LYAYFIPFKALNKDKLAACDPNSTAPNLCNEGAAWIRNNTAYLQGVYATYADQIATIWGTTRPLIWLFEPDYNNYIRDSQSEPLTPSELSFYASALIGTVKARLPKAIISHYASPSIGDFSTYFGALDLSLVDLINVTGSANYDYFFSNNSIVNPEATYRSLHEATGLPIFVDTGFSASEIPVKDWLTVSTDVINQRIADGVIGVLMNNGTSTLQTRITTTASQSSPLNCSQ
jgi:hypothetical protein